MERELTEPVDLCLPDGRHLNDDARGWSRTPLVRPNLRGRPGRTKRWDYWAILTRDLAVAITYADVDYLGIAAVWWVDLRDGRSGGREVTVPLARGIDLPDVPGSAPLTYRSRDLHLVLSDTPAGTDLTARWRERDGRIGHLEATVARPSGHESVNVVIPWSPTRFQYTSKQQARPTTGTVRVGDERWEIGADEAWGVLDVGRGRWPYRTRWNWGGGAGVAVDGRTIGIQVGGRWTEGTGATENGIVVDGEVVKIGDELTWRYDWDAPMDPWHLRSPDGTLDLVLTPRYDRHARTEAVVLGTEVHQVFGTWDGQVPTPAGDTATVAGIVGFAEESRSRW